ncbi:MAG: SHOCT domain-containing protein [Desulfamplus sp.]|nr:SHOCT domain-containing protein [Desulfamplus sp.]
MKFKPTDKEGVFKSLFAAYFVLLLHIFLVVGVGVTVVLFKGVYEYLPWILSGIAVLVIAIFWIFYLRIKQSSTDIHDVLSHPAFQNRNVEIKLLGGVATFKLSMPPTVGDNILLQDGQSRKLLQEQTTANYNQDHHSDNQDYTEVFEQKHQNQGHTNIERRLTELAALYNRGLINDEEYEMAKKQILFESNQEIVE